MRAQAVCTRRDVIQPLAAKDLRGHDADALSDATDGGATAAHGSPRNRLEGSIDKRSLRLACFVRSRPCFTLCLKLDGLAVLPVFYSLKPTRRAFP